MLRDALENLWRQREFGELARGVVVALDHELVAVARFGSSGFASAGFGGWCRVVGFGCRLLLAFALGLGVCVCFAIGLCDLLPPALRLSRPAHSSSLGVVFGGGFCACACSAPSSQKRSRRSLVGAFPRGLHGGCRFGLVFGSGRFNCLLGRSLRLGVFGVSHHVSGVGTQPASGGPACVVRPWSPSK